MEALRCSSCGAPLNKSNNCSYCGTNHIEKFDFSAQLNRMKILAGIQPKSVTIEHKGIRKTLYVPDHVARLSE